MKHRASNLRSQLLAAAAIALCAAPATTGGTGTTNDCRHGPAHGLWQLPGPTTTALGVVDGWLAGPSTTSSYHFVGTLTPVPSPCLSCIEGRVQGTLDDGVGAGPDYHVVGTYRGAFLSGQGHFRVRVISTTAAGPSGTVLGLFHDAPGDNLPGAFTGRWQICP